MKCNMEPSLNIRSFRIGNLVYNPHLERIGYIAEITRADMTLFHGEMLIKEAGFYHEILDKVVLWDVRPIRLTPTLLENAALRKNLATVTNDLTTISSPVWYAYLLKRRVLLAGGRRNRRLQCGCAHKVSAPAPEYIFYIDRNGAECRKDIWCENVKSRGNSAFCLSFQTDRIKNRVRFDMSFSRFMIEAGLWVDYLF